MVENLPVRPFNNNYWSTGPALDLRAPKGQAGAMKPGDDRFVGGRNNNSNEKKNTPNNGDRNQKPTAAATAADAREKKIRNMVTRIRIASRFSLWPLDVLIDLLLWTFPDYRVYRVFYNDVGNPSSNHCSVPRFTWMASFTEFFLPIWRYSKPHDWITRFSSKTALLGFLSYLRYVHQWAEWTFFFPNILIFPINDSPYWFPFMNHTFLGLIWQGNMKFCGKFRTISAGRTRRQRPMIERDKNSVGKWPDFGRVLFRCGRPETSHFLGCLSPFILFPFGFYRPRMRNNNKKKCRLPLRLNDALLTLTTWSPPVPTSRPFSDRFLFNTPSRTTLKHYVHFLSSAWLGFRRLGCVFVFCFAASIAAAGDAPIDSAAAENARARN